MYGYDGESEKMIGDVLHDVRDEIVIATKCGWHWKNKASISDATPKRIIAECDESLLRLGTDRVELYYLHAPDPQVPIAESAGAIRELMQAGKVLSAGLSNASVAELTEFNAVCPLSAYQPHYNMLQREIEDSQIPWCIENSVSAMVYWPLMKGLLAGKLSRDHQFIRKMADRSTQCFKAKNGNGITTSLTVCEKSRLTPDTLFRIWSLTGLSSVRESRPHYVVPNVLNRSSKLPQPSRGNFHKTRSEPSTRPLLIEGRPSHAVRFSGAVKCLRRCLKPVPPILTPVTGLWSSSRLLTAASATSDTTHRHPFGRR